MRKKISSLALALPLILVFGLFNQAFAEVSFSVKKEEIPKTKILFFGFDSSDPYLRQDQNEILNRIQKNLKTTDLFEIIKNSGRLDIKSENKNENSAKNSTNSAAENAVSSSQNELNIESIPDFEKYSKASIGAIVIAQFNYDSLGNLEIRIRLWDALDQRQIFGKFYSVAKDNYRKVSNIISDEIYKGLTGEISGNFNTKIVYVTETGPVLKRIKKISTMDFDGENQQYLTNGSDLVMTPIFSKRNGEIFYLRYFEGRSQIFSLDVNSLRSRKVGGFRGTTFAPSINPKNPNVILLSAISDGNSDIFELDINSNSAQRLTKSPSIDTTASYSPDAKYITFASDRADGQQIYVSDSKGLRVERISFGGGSYSKPVWSPDGKLIAFTKIKSGKFFIGVMPPNGQGERILTSAYLVEGAKWSPNGRYLIYSKKSGPYGRASMPRLYIIDVITGFEFEVPTPKNEGASDPDWI